VTGTLTAPEGRLCYLANCAVCLLGACPGDTLDDLFAGRSGTSLSTLCSCSQDSRRRTLMLAEFPEDYPRYRQRVPQLVPGLRLIGPRKVASS
jgi:hypothetical protein